MNEWLDKTEINLELLTTDPPNPEEKLTLEEQMVLIKVKLIMYNKPVPVVRKKKPQIFSFVPFNF